MYTAEDPPENIRSLLVEYNRTPKNQTVEAIKHLDNNMKELREGASVKELLESGQVDG